MLFAGVSKERLIMGKYFGTDGFRGKANVELTAEKAFKVGRYLGWYYSRNHEDHRARIVIGKDTRRSSYMLEDALCAGLTSSGADAYLLHVTTTPSVSYCCRMDGFDCGIMISASHNPFYDNGIKIMRANGQKIEPEIEEKIEEYIDGLIEELPYATDDAIGRSIDYSAGRNRYIGYLMTIPSRAFNGKRVALDCANGASSMIAKSVFEALGAKTFVINNQPDGVNINRDCGSTHMGELKQRVVEEGAVAGLAFDGDADRFLAVDEKGNLVDGDQIMGIVGKEMKRKGTLKGDTIVVTVMSNLGFFLMGEREGFNIERTKVGDRYVLERMLEIDSNLGGEQSGHVIYLSENTTGDGLLSALHLLQVMQETGKPLSELASIMTVLPQALVNAKVANDKKEHYLDYPEVAQACKDLEDRFAGRGRVLIRPSGTEPLVRVMIEGEDQEQIKEEAQKLADLIARVMG